MLSRRGASKAEKSSMHAINVKTNLPPICSKDATTDQDEYETDRIDMTAGNISTKLLLSHSEVTILNHQGMYMAGNSAVPADIHAETNLPSHHGEAVTMAEHQTHSTDGIADNFQTKL